jgi:hypothetical protein
VDNLSEIFGVVEGRFYRGFWEKWCVDVVALWLLSGEKCGKRGK